ncbi:hypothetical protein glysoja_031267 [Glycine soja]|uniref:Uncharacterized protein n=1 Tax=Glycine soja TaxID=3848 RepID=A0A0B2SQR8_GLYSO|nr:hypothetical protein glysoja_031267 [Glycine soja]
MSFFKTHSYSSTLTLTLTLSHFPPNPFPSPPSTSPPPSSPPSTPTASFAAPFRLEEEDERRRRYDGDQEGDHCEADGADGGGFLRAQDHAQPHCLAPAVEVAAIRLADNDVYNKVLCSLSSLFHVL